jgi:hypothetical protein
MQLAALLRGWRDAAGCCRPSTSAWRRRTPTRDLVAAQQIRAEHPGISVLVLAEYVEPQYTMRLFEEHPERVGYMPKERVLDVASLIDALRRLADGATVVDPTIVARLFARKRRPGPLAERGREILTLTAEGCPAGPSPPRVRHRTYRGSPHQADLPSSASTRGPAPTGASWLCSPTCADRAEPQSHKQALAPSHSAAAKTRLRQE